MTISDTHGHKSGKEGEGKRKGKRGHLWSREGIEGRLFFVVSFLLFSASSRLREGKEGEGRLVLFLS